MKSDHKTKMGFIQGFIYPFSSLRFINQHPGLVRFILIPFLINVLVFCLVVYFGFGAFQGFVLSKIPHGDAWYWFLLNYFLIGLGMLVTLVLVFFTFTVVGSLIASPFNDILSERTEEILSGTKDKSTFSFPLFVKEARRAVSNEGKKIAMFVAGMLVLLLLHLLPVIGSILYSVLSVLWTIFFLVVEYTGYVFSRKRIEFSEQRNIILSRFSMMFGFGTAVFCVLVIPFFQFLCIPLGVVGATRLLFDSGCVAEEKGERLVEGQAREGE